MFKALSATLKLSLFTFACLFTTPTLAQVTTDSTVNTQVNQNGNVAEITGGESRGSNLFHSFGDFSVPTGNEAFFNNADNISNIFSRVTGGNISNIDGAIRANGSASLFLINPAGIIFGENARLDIGGSFYGSTASSVLFEDGEFSAVDNLAQPTLTVNAPIGLGFRDEPGDIINRSRVTNSSEETVGLEINSGNTLAFIGGNINFESGNATASGGNIRLGGLSQTGIVGLNPDGSFSFPANVALSNITLINGAIVDARGFGGGNITVDAQNLTLEAGEFDRSVIGSGIRPQSTNPEVQRNVAGDVVINVAENIRIDNGGIVNQVTPEGIGNAGSIVVNTSSLELLNGGSIDATTFGQGDAGAVEVTVTGDITASGENSDGFLSGITSGVDTGATGDSGGVRITTTNLNLTAGGRVDATTFGQGDAGAVEVTATGDITASGENSDGFSSGITSGVNTDATGNSAGIKIATTNLNLTSGGRVSAGTLGQGDAGAVEVTTSRDIIANGENSDGFSSGIFSLVNPSAIGNSGGVKITTTNLNLTAGGRVAADTLSEGDANNVDITAIESISIDGSTERFRSGISANAIIDNGNGGNIFIDTDKLTITNGGTIEATNFDNIGNDIDIPGGGRPGNITINADTLALDNARIEAATRFRGEASGNINLNIAKNITLNNNSLITARAFGDANGGNLTINTDFIIAYQNQNNGTGNDLIATADRNRGEGGSITLNVLQVFGLERGNAVNPFFTNNINDIDASSDLRESSDSGDVTINTSRINPVQGTTELPSNVIVPEETSQQACEANRESAAKNGLNITGKGGIVPDPKLPLESLNVSVNGESTSATVIPQPVKTSQGKIQPARGVEVTKSGEVILTAHRTNNAGERVPQGDRNCSRS